jgi:hypothetical protein
MRDSRHLIKSRLAPVEAESTSAPIKNESQLSERFVSQDKSRDCGLLFLVG